MSSLVAGFVVSTFAAAEVLMTSALPTLSTEKYLTRSPWFSFGLAVSL
jgi:hypothetical protein